MMRRLLLILLVFVLFAVVANGNVTAKKTVHKKPHTSHTAPLHLYKDASNIPLKHFDQQALTKFSKNPDFNYADHAGAGEMSLLEKIWLWIKDVLFGWTKNAHIDGTWAGLIFTVLKYLLYAAALAFVIFIVIKAIGIDFTSLLRRRSRKTDIAYTESIEDINAIDFDDELEKALAQNNYRLAVRLLYLHCLKQLSDLQLIHWQIDKTNSAYVNELADPSQKQVFRIITRQFEYVWYGNFSIDKTAFVGISQLFQDFKQQLP